MNKVIWLLSNSITIIKIIAGNSNIELLLIEIIV